MIKTIEYGRRVETADGYIETYRNDAGDTVIAVCNPTRGEDARLAFHAGEIEDIVKMIKRSRELDVGCEDEEDIGDSSGFGLHTDMILGENPDMLRQD